MVPCSGIVWGELWAKIFRIFFQTHICIYTGAEIKRAIPPVGWVESLGVGIYFLHSKYWRKHIPMRNKIERQETNQRPLDWDSTMDLVRR